MNFEGENWYLVRRNAQKDKWHPATDNALGTDDYGEPIANPTGENTFTIKYKELKWNHIMFAWGDLE